MSTKEKKEFVDNFIELLADEGDMFWSMGSVSKDYDAITSVLKAQGYWAGNAVRYMFDKNLKFEAIQPRMFGG